MRNTLKPTVEDILELLSTEQYEIASMLNNLAQELNLKKEAKIGKKERYKLIYSISKPRRVLFRFETSKGGWRVKANLFSIDEYPELAKNASDTIKNYIKATRECTMCNEKCKKGAAFTLDGNKYFSCIGSGHYFKDDMKSEDWNMLTTLIKAENDVSQISNKKC